MATRRGVLAALAQAGAWAGLSGSQAARLAARQRPLRSGEVFHAGAELVPTPVTVRDAQGRLVTSLDRDDFAVAESGREQPITQFARDRVPVSLALVLDISDSMRGPRMDDARAALDVFVSELLSPEDEAALLVFNHSTRLLSGWTLDRAPLREALAAVRPTGGTAIYDAIGQALPLFTERRHPRGAIVLVSDGADTASDTAVVELKQQLGRGDVFLYGIAVDTPNARSSTRINPQVFHELSAQSGGYAEIVSSTAEIGPAATRIAEELNAQYMLGYSPTTPGNGRYRSIRFTVSDGDGYVVRARRGVVS
ncbi:MAG: VWA domain-containing protein [Vicinamibacterales bacterium]